jgi:signal transduction histidine kinase
MRWALVKVALAATTMVALAFLIPLGVAVDHLASQRAIAGAQAKVAAIEPLLAVTTDRTELTQALDGMSDSQDVAVRLPGGGQVGADHLADSRARTIAAGGRAVTLAVPGGSELVQPEVVRGGGVTLIEVFIDDAQTRQGVLRAWLVLSGVALALIVGGAVVADRLGARIVRASRHLAQASRQLGDGDTAVRINAEGPHELREAGLAFNAMADRVVHLLAAERELVADLSHRLRTPLTALRLNASSVDGPAAASMVEAVTRLEQEVDTIIRAARSGGATGTCDVAAVVTERMAFWSALAEDQERPWQLVAAAGPVPVAVAAPELAAALDAVLGNVFRHTPEGTAFQVTVHEGEGAVAVLIDDAGPGLAEPARALVRGEGSGGIGSTGLGLDIVQKLTTRCGGSLTVDRSPLGGAQIHLSLPTTAAGSRRPALFPTPRRSRSRPRRARHPDRRRPDSPA